MAGSAPTPDGYAEVFANKQASLSASNYMGLYTLDGYDTLTWSVRNADIGYLCLRSNSIVPRSAIRLLDVQLSIYTSKETHRWILRALVPTHQAQLITSK